MRVYVFFISIALAFVTAANAQTSIFTYQGKLTDTGTPASGTYQMQFSLFDVPIDGSPIAAVVTNNSVSVSSGIFTVDLSFATGPFEDGGDRWLEIAVKRPADPVFTTLAPRQQITSSPFSIRTGSAGLADNANALDNQPASFYRNANNLNAGTVPDARLGSNVSRRDMPNIFQPSFDSTGLIIRRAATDSVSNIFSVHNSDSTQTHFSVNSSGQVFWQNALGQSLALLGPLSVNTGAATDAIFLEDRVERNSAANESYTFRNPGPGAFQLRVDNTASSTTPTYAFSGDTDTGFFSSIADSLDFATGGVHTGQINSTGFKTVGGSVSTPGFSFLNDTDTGFFNLIPDSLDFATGGVQSARVNATGIKSVNGSAAAPAFSFINDTDTGIFRSNANTLDFTTGGNTALQINGAGTVKVLDGMHLGGDGPFSLVRPVSTTGAGTVLTINGQGGMGGGNNAGGTVVLLAGGGTGTANGGDVVINAGQATGTGQDGKVILGQFGTSEIVLGTSTNVVNTSRPISGATAKMRTETSDLTPSVQNLTVLVLEIGGFIEITDLTGGEPGQCVTLIQNLGLGTSVLTIEDAGNFKLNGDWLPGGDSSLTVCRGPSHWYEASRSSG